MSTACWWWKQTAVGVESALSRIIRWVEQAQAAKAPVQRIDRVSAVFGAGGDRYCAVYVGGVVAGGASADAALINAVTVLVIALPPALGLCNTDRHHGWHGRGSSLRYSDQRTPKLWNSCTG